MSASPSPCPSPESLESAAVGGGVSATLLDHLSRCETCRATLERIREDNRFLSGFAVGGAFPITDLQAPIVPIAIPGYEIVREVHRGGQGVVYQAMQRSTQRMVAVKVMKQGPFATPADRTRFDREIDLLGKLNHPNIVMVHDAGTVAGFQFLVMNYIDGHPLDELLIEPAPTTDQDERAPGDGRVLWAVGKPVTEAALALFIKVCDAVHAAHLRGVIHRDLKPSNIRVDRSGEPHVLDFGLAKTLGEPDETGMTRTGQFVGSLPWASPEQIEGEASKIDLRTDVYSLGVLLFQVLTGRLPFDVASNLRNAVDNIVYREPPRPSVVAAQEGRPRVDDELETIVLKCLSKDRERRYQTAGELARDLRHYLAGEVIEAKRDSAAYMLKKTLNRYRLPATLAALSVLLLSTFGVVMAVLYRRASLMETAAAFESQKLADSLAQSTIERGRLLAATGSIAAAERLLWTEYFAAEAASVAGRQAHWALRELYSRNPCLATRFADGSVAYELEFVGDSGDVRFVDRAGRIRRWRVPDGELETLHTILPMPDFPLARLSGDSVAVRAPGHVSLWDCRTGAHLLDLQTGDPPILAMAQSDSRTYFAVGLADGRVLLFDQETGRQIRSWSAHAGGVTSARFDSSRRRLYTGGADARACLWDVETGELLAENVLEKVARGVQVTNLTLSPDESRVAMALRWNVVLLNTETLAERRDLEGARGAIQGLGYSPDGRWIVSAGHDKRILIWDVQKGTVERSLAGHAGAYTGLAFSPDAKLLVSAATDGAIRVWDTGIGEQRPGGVLSEIDCERAVQAVAAVDDGREIFVSTEDGRVWSQDPQSSQHTMEYVGHTDVAYNIALSPDGQHFATCSRDASLRFWQRGRSSPLRTVDTDDPTSYAPGIGELRAPGPQYIAYSPRGDQLIVGSWNGVIGVWDVERGCFVRIFHAHQSRITMVCYANSGDRFASSAMDGTIAVWDAATNQELLRVAAHSGGARAVDVSQDGAWLASGGDDATMRIWDARSGKCLHTCRGHQQDVFAVSFSPDGTLVASGERGLSDEGTSQIIVWDVESGRDLYKLSRHTDMVFALKFLPDSRRLLSCGRDKRVLLHDLAYFDRHIDGNAGVIRTLLRAAGTVESVEE